VPYFHADPHGGHYLKRWGFTPQKPIKESYEQRPEAVKQWLDEQYPGSLGAPARGGEIHWGDETHWSIPMYARRGFAPKGKTPVAYHPYAQRLSMIATVPTKLCTLADYRRKFRLDRLIEFLELLIKDAGKKCS